ncbi:MAG TPA: UTP--glucose-1-phosphate uridylyltransferase [Caulobacteraceae bacterium]
MNKPIRKAVLPVAGLGTRVLPAAKTVAKELLNVFDRPIIAYAIAEARAAGIEHVVMVTGRGKQALEDYFDHNLEVEAMLAAKGRDAELAELVAELPRAGEMSFVRQMAPLGLGHAVWCAREIIGDEPFAVILPDMLMGGAPSALEETISAYQAVGGNIVAVEAAPPGQTHKYGIVALGEAAPGFEGRLSTMRGMVEKPPPGTEPSNLFISGRYILQPEIFALLGEHRKGAGGEIQLTDAMAALMARQSFHALEYRGLSYDCGDRVGLLAANLAMALAHPTLGAQARAAASAVLAAS